MPRYSSVWILSGSWKSPWSKKNDIHSTLAMSTSLKHVWYKLRGRNNHLFRPARSKVPKKSQKNRKRQKSFL